MMFATRRVSRVLAAVAVITAVAVGTAAPPAGALAATSTSPANGPTVQPPAEIEVGDRADEPLVGCMDTRLPKQAVDLGVVAANSAAGPIKERSHAL